MKTKRVLLIAVSPLFAVIYALYVIMHAHAKLFGGINDWYIEKVINSLPLPRREDVK